MYEVELYSFRMPMYYWLFLRGRDWRNPFEICAHLMYSRPLSSSECGRRIQICDENCNQLAGSWFVEVPKWVHGRPVPTVISPPKLGTMPGKAIHNFQPETLLTFRFVSCADHNKRMF